MKPILFCNIAYMTYYNGVAKNFDEPVNGGKWVNENNDAMESHNFSVYTSGDSILFDSEKKYCIGFVQTKSEKITLERIYGCETAKKDEKIDGIIVVWCATPQNGQKRVVGWYKNATVMRYTQYFDLTEDDQMLEQWFNSFALKDDCVLLPEKERTLSKWYVPNSSKNSNHFGFGQSNVWYGKITDNTQKALSNDEFLSCQEKLNEYLENLIANIENYDGENWLDDF